MHNLPGENPQDMLQLHCMLNCAVQEVLTTFLQQFLLFEFSLQLLKDQAILPGNKNHQSHNDLGIRLTQQNSMTKEKINKMYTFETLTKIKMVKK